jgi:hypothetical protein
MEETKVRQGKRITKDRERSLMEQIWYAPGLVRHARHFLGHDPMPDEASVRRAIRTMVLQVLIGNVVVGGPQVRWVPHPLLHGYDRLYLAVMKGELWLYATRPVTGGQDGGGFALRLDMNQPGLTRVVAVSVFELPAIVGLDPTVWSWESDRANSQERITWTFTRLSKPRWYEPLRVIRGPKPRSYELRVRRPADAAGPWTATLVGVYGAGERFVIPRGHALIANALVPGPDRAPRYRSGLVRRGRIRLLEPAVIGLNLSSDPFDTPQAAFAECVELLPISGELAEIERQPNHRLPMEALWQATAPTASA